MKRLNEKGLSDVRTGEVERKNTRTRGKSSRQLKQWEIEELMGVNRQKYSRGKGGVIRGR